MIDLHLHTCASDGRSTPRELALAARHARLTTISVTDHDTVAALDEAAEACAADGLDFVPGIEITAARGDTEIHLLGYFFDRRSPGLLAFLEAQRADRVRRVREMIAKLRDLSLPVNEGEIFDSSSAVEGRAIGRPLIARAMVRAGHVRTRREAFDLYLAEGRAAFVPRHAPAPGAVIATIHEAGGVASLAHPGLLAHDDWIPAMAAAGLDAIEAFYSEHSPEAVQHYRRIAAGLDLALSGGSDYHGHVGHGPLSPGDAVLPEDEFARLKARVGRGGKPAERRVAREEEP